MDCPTQTDELTLAVRVGREFTFTMAKAEFLHPCKSVPVTE